jgi:signal transduction histidine kinase
MPSLAADLYSAGHKPFDLQIERLISLLRVALTAFATAAFYDDPIRAGQDTTIIIYVLGTYALFGLTVVSIPLIWKVRTGWQLPIHIIDVGMISLLMHFLERVSSPFILLYTFLLLGATVRWSWRGALWTTLSLLSLDLLLILLPPLSTDMILPIPNIIIRGAFLIVVGIMFAYFGASRDAIRERLTELAAWPKPVGKATAVQAAAPLDETLNHVASILKCPRILLLWGEADEPVLNVVLWVDGHCQQHHEPADAFGNWTPPELSKMAYATTDVNSGRCNTLTGPVVCEGALSNKLLRRQFGLTSVASAPITGENCTGRIFMLDKPEWSEEDLVLTEIVASRTGIELDQHALRLELADKVAATERVRLARDLHDGVLQGLIAASLHLKSVTGQVRGATSTIIDNVLELLLDQQRRIRHFIGGGQQAHDMARLALSVKMQQLVEQNRLQWACDISLSVWPDDATIPPELGDQLTFIMAETVANAVRHGQASRIDVMVRKSSDRVLLCVKDNGRGLEAATGTYNEVELASRDLGPVSLRTRVAELHGSISLATSPQGVDLRIGLPA